MLDAWRPLVEEVEFLAALRPEEEEAGGSSGAGAGLGDVASSLATQSSRLVDGLRALLGQRAAAAESAALALVADEAAAPGAAEDAQDGEGAEADTRAQEEAAQWTPDHARLLCTENECLYALQARLLREVRERLSV